MGWLFFAIGLVIAVIGYGRGILLDPASAPQQAVQELRLIQGAIGVVIAALGGGFEMLRTASAARAALSPGAPGARPVQGDAEHGARIGPARAGIVVGALVEHESPRVGRGRVLSVDGDSALVEFGKAKERYGLASLRIVDDA